MTDDDIRQFLDSDYERVVRVVTAVCGDRQRAEDAVQESLVDVWGKGQNVDDVARWVTAAAVNRARSRWRSRSAEQRAFDRLASRRSTIETSEPSTFDTGLASALNSLPLAQRQVVALHYLMDLSVVDVGAYLGIAEGTVKPHLYRGRLALRAAMGVAAPRKGESHARS